MICQRGDGVLFDFFFVCCFFCGSIEDKYLEKEKENFSIIWVIADDFYLVNWVQGLAKWILLTFKLKLGLKEEISYLAAKFTFQKEKKASVLHRHGTESPLDFSRLFTWSSRLKLIDLGRISKDFESFS